MFSLKFDNKKFPVHSANLTVSSSVRRMEHFEEVMSNFTPIVRDEWQYNNYNSRQGSGPRQCSSRSQNNIVSFQKIFFFHICTKIRLGNSFLLNHVGSLDIFHEIELVPERCWADTIK